MNQDPIEGRWTEVKGKAKEQWGKLTDNGLLEIEGDQDRLIGEEAEKQVREFLSRQ